MSDPLRASPPGPGQPASDPPRSRTLSRRVLLEHWWTVPVAAGVGVLGWMGVRAYRITFGKTRPAEPNFQTPSSVRVAPLSAFDQDFASVNFVYGQTPCIALRVPQPDRSSVEVEGRFYVAFSRVCTHLGCAVDPVRSEATLALSFNYRPERFHPMLGCPCHFSVFDPLREGESVFGQALYPLPRVRLEVRGGALYATGLEPNPLPGGRG